jgi:hypothetical protein
VKTPRNVRPKITATATARVQPGKLIATDLLLLTAFRGAGKPPSYEPIGTLMITH